MQNIGQQWEKRAALFLVSQGLFMVARNYITRCGEIDLIMSDQNTLVFIEVRFRASRRFGGALNSIRRGKQEKLLKCAKRFLQLHPAWSTHPCRFDVIAYDAASSIDNPLWIRAAFD
jgi:putative endonuclease